MFRDSNFKQFKAYISKIDDFDQLYIIQQGGREVTQSQMINRLRNAILDDYKSVYKSNQTLFNNIEINKIKIIDNAEKFKSFVESEYFETIVGNSILITK